MIEGAAGVIAVSKWDAEYWHGIQSFLPSIHTYAVIWRDEYVTYSHLVQILANVAFDTTWYNLDIGACEIPQVVTVVSQGYDPPYEGLDINDHNSISDRNKEWGRK